MTELFLSTLNQMAVLFSLILVGYLLVKLGCVSENAAGILSKLENILLVPALILNTFMTNFTVEKLSTAWKLIVLSTAIALLCLPVSFAVTKRLFKEERARKVSTYALNFSNFGFMGNAVVQALFQEIFLEYVIFTIPLWTLAYVWGVPTLLVPPKKSEMREEETANEEQEKAGKIGTVNLLLARLKNLVNPMFVCVIIGAIIGLTGLKLPKFIGDAVGSVGACMSPLAMILTGFVSTKIHFKEMLKKWRIYVIGAVRVLFFPLAFILVFTFIPQSAWITPTFLKCGIAVMAMPMGMTGVFVPVAYGEDTTPVAEMVIVSHVLSAVTIPLIFMLFQAVVL